MRASAMQTAFVPNDPAIVHAQKFSSSPFNALSSMNLSHSRDEPPPPTYPDVSAIMILSYLRDQDLLNEG